MLRNVALDMSLLFRAKVSPFVSVRKSKPSGTPRSFERDANRLAATADRIAREARLTIERSKVLVTQSRQVVAQSRAKRFDSYADLMQFTQQRRVREWDSLVLAPTR